MIRFCFLCLAFSCIHLLHAQPLSQGTSIYIYNDGHFDTAIKKMKKELKEPLTLNKIKWKQKSNKNATWVELKNNVDKILLKKNADCYVLSLGINDIWNKRKKTANEYSEKELQSNISAVIDTLSTAKKHIILFTPHLLYEGTQENANQHIQKLTDILNSFAQRDNVTICDTHESFTTFIAQAKPAKHGKGISTKDGYKLNNAGEAIVKRLLNLALGISANNGSTTLKPITLKKRDYIVLACGFHRMFPTKRFNDASKLMYEEKMPFETPRFAGTSLRAEDLFKEGTAQRLLQQKASYYILLPQFYYHVKKFNACYYDGSYEEKFTELVRKMKKQTDAHIYLMTPPIWNENTKANDLVIDGPMYKMSAGHADLIRRVARATNCPVFDLHQRCLDAIQRAGSTAGLQFAGTRTVNGKNISMVPLGKISGVPLLKAEIIKLFGVTFK